jgi:hypothetical protein
VEDSAEISDEINQKRLRWGALLVWSPWIPIAIGLGITLRGIAKQKVTGIGAVAGGLTELFVVWGIGTILMGQITAIILLSRALSAGHWVRNLFSFVSIGLSFLMLLLEGLFLWLSWFQPHHGF